MFSFPLMLVPFRVEIKPVSTFLVTFWTYGFNGSGFPLMLMLIVFLVSRFFFMIGPTRLLIISISLSGSFVVSINGVWCLPVSVCVTEPVKARIGLKTCVASSISFLFFAVTILGTVRS